MVKFGKMFKKMATGQESAKDAFSDFEAFQALIEPYAFNPFDMIATASESIDILLGQREVRQPRLVARRPAEPDATAWRHVRRT